MTRFDRGFTWILRWEGDYSDHPADRGGKTKYGISAAAHPGLDIEALTKTQARSIYHDDYWLSARCNRMPERLDIVAFDTAVLHGPKMAIVLLQQSLGVAADGIYGPVTNRAAWQAEPRMRGLIHDILSRRLLFVSDLVSADSSQAAFLRGWFRRILALQTHVTCPGAF